MPSHSSGRIAKVRKFKNATPHQKNHRWESFSTKIAKFNSLQPLRKVRRHDLDTEDLSTSTSYFQTGLQKWSELNVARGFTSFKRDVLPLSESLPQILHFEEKIMGSLANHISEHDKESLEPLLDLLTAFAHDLGIRFEKYYGKSLELILAIAGKTQDVEVIEWTFGALAFLFKYLSKLLVPDLRPTFAVLAPLLGKARHPPYIARFAAEAMSFLVRKAAAPSLRETALVLLIKDIREDLGSMTEDRQFTLYNDGLMTMFAEAIKGTDRTIHSVGASIMTTIIDAIPKEEESISASTTTWTDLVCGVLTSSIHHSTFDTFGEIAESVLTKCEGKTQDDATLEDLGSMIPYIRLLGVVSGVRKGSRINDWSRHLRQLVAMLCRTTKSVHSVPVDEHGIIWRAVIANIAITCHHAPMDSLIPHITSLNQSLTREPFMRWFIPFCSYFSKLDSGRFASLFRNDFQK